MRTVLAIALALLAAGCVTPNLNPSAVVEDVVDLAKPFAWDHDHADSSLHALSWNVHEMAHLAPAVEGREHVSHNEIDVAGDLAFVGVNHGWIAYDVTDATNPVFLHYEPMPEDQACVGDLKIGQSGTSLEGVLVVGTQCNPSATIPGGVRPPAQPTRGLLLYDVTDPAAPTILSKGPPGHTCHMVDTQIVGEREFVYCATLEGPIAYELVDTPAGARTPVVLNPNLNRDPTTFRHVPRAMDEFGTNGYYFMFYAHDMTTQEDPLTEEPIVVVSHAYNGVRILDGTDPRAGRVLGQWSGEGADDYSWIHTAAAVEQDGKRLVVAITENVVDTPPRLWILDFTDYAAPTVLSEFRLGGQDNSHELAFSLHNFQIVDDKVYIAAYHAGVWVVDISDPAAPKEVGFGLSAGENPYTPPEGTFYGIGNDWSTQVWDVVLKDGYMLVSDMRSGFYVMHHTDDPAGEDAYDSFV